MERISPALALAQVPVGVLSHESAARAGGVELLRDDDRTRLTVPRNRGRIRLVGWTIHRADLRPDELLEADGLRITAPGRTVADLARVLPLADAVAAADSAMRNQLVSHDELRAQLSAATGRGAARPREVARLLDPKSGSVLESALRVLLLVAGLAPAQSQYVIRAGRVFVARVDFCWPAARLVVEADGFAFHSDRAAYRADRRRFNQLESLGWRVLRFSWEDVLHRPDYVIGAVRDCLRLAAAA